MTHCPNHWRGHHKFEARFETGPGTMKTEGFHGTPAAFERMMEAMRGKIYVRDVCIRCGETIERQPVTPPPVEMCQQNLGNLDKS